MKTHACAGLVALLLLLALPAQAATYHADTSKGNDANDGLSDAKAFATLKKACETVKAGDTVIVAPGIYFEVAQLQAAGTPDKPITFRAAKVEKNAVIVTGAVPDIRRGKVEWRLDDAELQLYSTPISYEPTRALYDGVDLYPYGSLEGLKRFRSTAVFLGPKHGFTTSGGRVYVRLHASGKYGPTDPKKHAMCFSPRGATGSWAGTRVESPQHYNFGVLAAGQAHVVLDGFTFETPGVVGVYVAGSHVTVRNCWFFGTRAGVGGKDTVDQNPRGGFDQPADFDFSGASNNVTVEFCYWTQFPTFSDLVEIIKEGPSPEARAALDKAGKKWVNEKVFFWHRKGQKDSAWGLQSKNGYETGIGNFMGKDWILRNNHIFEAWDGISANATMFCRGLQVYDNLFEKCADNAVEAENHARDMHVYRNVIVDSYEPLSWQPEGGIPWPGPVYFHHNIVYNTPEFALLWDKVSEDRGWLKAGASKKNWESYNPHMADVPKDSPAVSPAPGFLVYNNTICFTGGSFLTTLGQDRPYKNFKFNNNIFVCGEINGKVPLYDAPGFEFARNIYAPSEPGKTAKIAERIAGGGKVLPDLAALCFKDADHGDFSLGESSPARGAGGEVPDVKDASPDAGALPFGKPWKMPMVGPQP